MQIASFPAGPWQTNCYVVAADGADTCVVVDPGVDAVAGVLGVCERAGLRLDGIVLTHGHLDHIASATALADAAEVPVWIHADDRPLLTDAGPGLAPFVAQLGLDLREPADLRLLGGGERVNVAGLEFAVVHAPGHRPGCVLYRLALPDVAAEPDAPREVIFTGDVLFAGSIGRTDLPGGDQNLMLATLRRLLATLPADAVLLPGHGQATTMAAETASNPYLQARFLKD